MNEPVGPFELTQTLRTEVLPSRTESLIVITELEFKSLTQQGFNRIPLMLEAFADLETPLSLYLKLAHAKDGGKYSFLLESVVGGERFGRYSFIGLPARTLLQASGFGADAKTEVVTDGVVVETATGNPLDFIEQYQQRFKVALRPGLPRFCGGLAGYFGYDAVRYIEKKLEKSCPPDTLGTPDILLLQSEELAVIDNLSGKLYLIVYADPGMPEAYAKAKKRLRELKELLKYSVSAPVVGSTQTHPAERDFKKRRLFKSRIGSQRADCRWRFHASASGTAHQEALHRKSLVFVPCPEVLEPQSLHVLLQLWRLPCGRCQPRNFGAPRKNR